MARAPLVAKTYLDEETGVRTDVKTGQPYVAPTATSGVRFLSSEAGQDLVDDAKSRIDTLTPPPPTTTDLPSSTSGDTKTSTTTEEKSGTSGGYTLDEVLGLTKNISGWEKQDDGTYMPNSLALKNLGVTGGDYGADLERVRLDKAKKERDSAFTLLTNFNVSNDPALRSVVSGISGKWDARIHEMERVNMSREAAMRTTGIRIGSRWTGGDGGVFGSIISEEERQGVERLADLENQKQSAIADAKQAYENQKWNKYYQLAGLADKKYQEQLDTVKAINKAQADQDKKLQEQNSFLIKGDAIYNAIAKLGGAKAANPLAIYENLRNQGMDVTMEDIDKFWDAVKPSTSSGGLYKFSNSQVGDFLARGYSSDMIQAIQDDLNDGGENAVLGGLSSGEQAWVRTILAGTETGGVGGNLTLSEARTLFKDTEYPDIAMSLAGKSEEQILNDLENPRPPDWFRNGIQESKQLTLMEDSLQELWDTFRSTTITNYFAGSSADSLGIFDTPVPAEATDEQ